jgi:hypothetical protein
MSVVHAVANSAASAKIILVKFFMAVIYLFFPLLGWFIAHYAQCPRQIYK